MMGKSSSKLNGDSVNFKALAASTPFTSSQLKHWHSEFIKECRDGEMDRDMFMKSFGSHFFPADANMAKLAEYVFRRFDTNQDGRISFLEFIKAVSIPSKGTIDEKLDWAFSIYDLDNDGFVTPDEMFYVVKALIERRGITCNMPNFAQQKVDEIFTKMDINHDGRLSKDEFIYGFKSDPQIVCALVNEKPNKSGEKPDKSDEKPFYKT